MGCHFEDDVTETVPSTLKALSYSLALGDMSCHCPIERPTQQGTEGGFWLISM